MPRASDDLWTHVKNLDLATHVEETRQTSIAMTTDQLHRLIRATPFRPFVIHTADGREVNVTHPEVIAYSGGRIALVALPNDGFEIIDLLLVTSLAGPPTNGGTSRRKRRER